MKPTHRTFLTDFFFVMVALVQLFGVVCAFRPELVVFYGLVHVLLAVILAVDFKTLPRSQNFTVSTTIAERLFLNCRNSLTIVLTQTAGPLRKAPFKALLPPTQNIVFDETKIELAFNQSAVRLEYLAETSFLAQKLGIEAVTELRLGTSSLFGFFNRFMVLPLSNELKIRVLPEERRMTAPVFQEILANQRIFLQGNRRLMRHLSPDQFHSLRPYQSGDALRFIDAKKFARYGVPSTRVFDSFNEHQVVVALDCGRASLGNLGQSRKFDFYLSACVKIAEAVLKAGDKMSLVGFSQNIHLRIAPTKSQQSFLPLFHGDKAFNPKEVDSSFDLMAQSVMGLAKQRSLVLILTDTTRPSIQENLKRALPVLSKKHMVVMLTLVDSAYSLDHLVSTTANQKFTTDNYASLMYAYFVKERLNLFRHEANKLGCGVLAMNEHDWITAIVKIYDLLRLSAAL